MAPPAKKSKKSNIVVLPVVGNVADLDDELLSPVHRINGYPWRLRIYEKSYAQVLVLICEKSSEAELWKCDAKVRIKGLPSITHSFTSWDSNSQECLLWSSEEGEELPIEKTRTMNRVEVEITTSDDGESWRCHPTLDPFAPRDGILVIGDEQKKVYVNKESLASQSPFFDRLFNGDFKEKNMDEIPIGDVEYEEFANIIRMIYGMTGASLTDKNVHRVLELADRFGLKIVEDRVVFSLLSPPSPIDPSPLSALSIHQKLIISEQCKLPFLKDALFGRLKSNERMMKELSESTEFEELSLEMVHGLFEMQCDQLFN